MEEPVELSIHKNATFPIRFVQYRDAEVFRYCLELYSLDKTIGKDYPLQAVLLTAETAKELGLIGDEDDQ